MESDRRRQCGRQAWGASLRRRLGLALNPHFLAVTVLGTLAANLIGGYVVGVAVAFFGTYSALAPEWRLLLVNTGVFAAGFTTFSTFSAEAGGDTDGPGRALLALSAAAAHLLGSVVMTFAGIGTVVWIRS